jgi:hypothetical protein
MEDRLSQGSGALEASTTSHSSRLSHIWREHKFARDLSRFRSERPIFNEEFKGGARLAWHFAARGHRAEAISYRVGRQEKYDWLPAEERDRPEACKKSLVSGNFENPKLGSCNG